MNTAQINKNYTLFEDYEFLLEIEYFVLQIKIIIEFSDNSNFKDLYRNIIQFLILLNMNYYKYDTNVR